MAELGLLQKQQLFVRLLAHLFAYVEGRGWALTLGDGYRPDGKGHMAGSLHYSRLAQDLNLFDGDEWIKDGMDPRWEEIGQFWESLHPLCRWGGRFSDANHFSIRHGGRS